MEITHRDVINPFQTSEHAYYITLSKKPFTWTRLVGLPYPPSRDNFIDCLYGCWDLLWNAKMADHMLKPVTMLLSIFPNAMVVNSTMTELKF